MKVDDVFGYPAIILQQCWVAIDQDVLRKQGGAVLEVKGQRGEGKGGVIWPNVTVLHCRNARHDTAAAFG